MMKGADIFFRRGLWLLLWLAGPLFPAEASLPASSATVVLKPVAADRTAAGRTADVSGIKPTPDRTVRGRVTDVSGVPLAGVVVRTEGGTDRAAVTDAEGRWTLRLPENAVLVFSCLGFVPETVEVAGRTFFELEMKEEIRQIDEVVVIGYGVRRKEDLTGSITSIDFDRQVTGRPVLNTAAALAGMAPGMTVMQNSGQPGHENTKIRIRGIGSFGSGASSPLVLVDGVEWDMNNVNPGDIASVSILKDAASTAIYGTRAANGVILVTTKNGEREKPRISYSYNGIFQQPYNRLRLVSDYAEYMELFNEGCFNAGLADKFSRTSIELWKAAKADPDGLNEHGVPNRVAYPNTDWFSEIFTTGYSSEHNLSVSGGGGKVKYLVSMGYLDNQGIMNRFNLDSSTQKANFRTNLEADVTGWFTVGAKIYGQLQQYGNANIANGFSKLYISTPGTWPGNEDGWGRPACTEESPTANNIFGHMAGATGLNRTWRVNGTLLTKLRPFKGLSLEAAFNYAPTFGERHTYSRPVTYWNYVTDELYSTSNLSNATVNNSFSRSYRASTELLARYRAAFGAHDLEAILGYSALEYRGWSWGLSKMGATDWSLNDLSTYDTFVDESSSPRAGWGLRSYFGRVNYAWKDRYLFEANLRADGSSKFGINTRYGLFPSFSMGWNLHREAFMAGTRDWLDQLKIRASYGETGNNAGIGNYAWQATYQTGGVVTGGVPGTGLYIASMSNPNLRWETTATADFGIDAGFFRNRLTVETDLYLRNTTDILFTPSTYLTMGNISQVPSNLGAMRNGGFELALDWRDTAGKDFYYRAGVNLSCNRNKVTSFKGLPVQEWQEGRYVNNIKNVSENWGTPGKLCEGHEIGEHYILQLYRGSGKGYQGGGVDLTAGPADGILRTETDMEWVRAMIASGYSFNGVTTLSPGQLWYGDFVFADTNGDGNYGNEDDKHFNGKSSTPAWNLGLNLGFSWKGVDFSMLWSGAFDYWIFWNSNYYNATNVTWGYALGQRIADDHYFYDPAHPEDPRTNLDGAYPRLYAGDDRQRQLCDFYEYRGDYLKLKNLRIGYTLPEAVTRSFFVRRLSFYFSAENLCTLSAFPGMDPELGSAIGYPLMRQYAVGAQIVF